MDINQMMDDFMDTYGVERTEMDAINCLSAYTLIDDELAEFSEEFETNQGFEMILHDEIDKANVCKEMADIIYVTAQRMRRMGCDVDSIMHEVHRSNMSKRVPRDDVRAELTEAALRYPDVIAQDVGDMFVLRDPNTGKVVKPTCYSSAQINEEMY